VWNEAGGRVASRLLKV
jgi:hypothetical protein